METQNFGQADDVMMVRAKRNYILMAAKVNKLISFFFFGGFSKRNRKHVLRVLSSYRNIRRSLRELKKAVELNTRISSAVPELSFLPAAFRG